MSSSNFREFSHSFPLINPRLMKTEELSLISEYQSKEQYRFSIIVMDRNLEFE